MKEHKDIVISGWRFVFVFAILFIMAVLATIGLIAIVWMCINDWPVIVGTGVRWTF